jgi:hypothetical protein
MALGIAGALVGGFLFSLLVQAASQAWTSGA